MVVPGKLNAAELLSMRGTSTPRGLPMMQLEEKTGAD